MPTQMEQMHDHPRKIDSLTNQDLRNVDIFEAKLAWLNETLVKNGFGGICLPVSRIWERARPGQCYDNVAKFVSCHPRFEGVFGYMINIVDNDFDFVMAGHAVVRERKRPEKLFHLSSNYADTGTKGMFVEDKFISFHMHQQLSSADELLRELLSKHVSHPQAVKMIGAMPFGRDYASSENDVLALLKNPELTPADMHGHTGRLRVWEIAKSGDLGGGEMARVGFSVFYDNLMNGIIVGLPRLMVAAAVRKHLAKKG